MSEQPKAVAAEAPAAMEEVVGRMLRVGTVAASVLVGIGVLGLVLNIAPPMSSQLVTAGLITLLATPVLRILSAIWVFLRERDYVFAAISAFVLLVLAIGTLLGKTH